MNISGGGGGKCFSRNDSGCFAGMTRSYTSQNENHSRSYFYHLCFLVSFFSLLSLTVNKPMAGQRTYNSNKNKRHLNVVKRKYGTIDWAFGGDEIGERGQVVATYVNEKQEATFFKDFLNEISWGFVGLPERVVIPLGSISDCRCCWDREKERDPKTEIFCWRERERRLRETNHGSKKQEL